MPDVRDAIGELRRSLGTMRDERVLLHTIEERVGVLREAYRRDPSLFTEDDVHFLRGLTPVSRALRSFLKESRRRGCAPNPLANARQLTL